MKIRQYLDKIQKEYSERTVEIDLQGQSKNTGGTSQSDLVISVYKGKAKEQKKIGGGIKIPKAQFSYDNSTNVYTISAEGINLFKSELAKLYTNPMFGAAPNSTIAIGNSLKVKDGIVELNYDTKTKKISVIG